MNPETPTCPNCGKPLATDALMGLCPDCLIKAGFGTLTGGGENARAFVPPSPEELAAHFPQLEILEMLGRGGMGAVYKARQKQLDRIVALKILPPSVSADPTFAGRFVREARALAKLGHPNIVTLYEFGEADGLFYFLMEFVDGVNLRQLLGTGRISPKEALAIVPQICDALQFAHDRGIVHRDIKPENVLLNKEGQVKIADFGVAKIMSGVTSDAPNAFGASEPGHTEVGKVIGTPQYMAPEQISNPAEVDNRADIYALGVVFYQMLTGELPKGRFAPPSKKVQIDVRLDEVVLRALEKEPGLRYQQASAMKTMVETIADTPLPGKAAAPKPTVVTQAEFDKMSRDPANWYFYFFYFCRHDPRIIVPKRISGLGWTVNLGNPLTLPFTIGFLAVLWGMMEITQFAGLTGDALLAVKVALLIGIVVLCHKLSMAPHQWKKVVLQSLFVILAILAVLKFVIAPYRATTDAVSPEIPRGSSVYVFKLARNFSQGDVIAYRDGDQVMLGRVSLAGPVKDTLFIERHDQPPQQIPASSIIGKVVFNTRAPANKGTPIASQPGAFTTPVSQSPELSYGPEVNGLRAALELVPPAGGIHIGDPIDMRFHVRNVSGKNILISGGSWRQDEGGSSVTMEDAQGKAVQVGSVWYSGIEPIQRVLLEPGESTYFHSSSFAFIAKNAGEDSVKHPVGYYAKVKPGSYTVRFHLHFPDIVEGNKPFPEDWQGDLDTAPMTVDVAAVGEPAPAQTPRPARSARPAEFGGAAWTDEVDSKADWRSHIFNIGLTDDTLLQPLLLAPPTREQQARIDAISPRPRYLYLWFYDPDFNAKSAAGVTLIKGTQESMTKTDELLTDPDDPANIAAGKVLFVRDGWVCARVYVGRMGKIPPSFAIRLVYCFLGPGRDTQECVYPFTLPLPGSQPSPPTAQSPTFGPVFEITLPEPAVGAKCFLDLDHGVYIAPPDDIARDFGPEDEKGDWHSRFYGDTAAEMQHWPAGTGADVAAIVMPTGIPGEEKGLTLFGGISMGPVDWDHDTPDDIVKTVLAAEEQIPKETMKQMPMTSMPAGKTLPKAYAFKTREGSIGLLQILALTQNPSGVKFRYKLVQNAPTPAPPQPTPQPPVQGTDAIFGPVLERTLHDPGEDRATGFINFETGKLPEPPADLKLKDEAAVWKWAKAQGVDAVANTSEEGRCLEGYDLHVAPVSDDDWEKPPIWEKMNVRIGAVEFRDWEAGGTPPLSHWVMGVNTVTTDSRQSRTFLFKTRNGTLGLLQFLEYIDSPHGKIKIRYKLALNAAAKPQPGTLILSSTSSAPDPDIRVTPGVNGGSGPAAVVNEGTSFGQVIERMLDYRRNAKGHDVLRLRDGEMSRLPNRFFDQSESTNWLWLTAQASKVFPGFSTEAGNPFPRWGLAGADLKIVVVPNAKWDGISVEDLDKALSQEDTGLGDYKMQGAVLHMLPSNPVLPVTCAFQTGDGDKGLLQILEIHDAGNTKPDEALGLKIRYKLFNDPLVRYWWETNAAGVQARLQPAKHVWYTDGTPSFSLDLRNYSTRPVSYTGVPQAECQVEVDGQWYGWSLPVGIATPAKELDPGEEEQGILTVNLGEDWRRPASGDVPKWAPGVAGAWGGHLVLQPGRHTLRVRFRPDGSTEVVSNPVVFVVEPAANRTAVFDTTIERDVFDGIDFDTGRLSDPPDPTPSGGIVEKRTAEWMDQHGMDAMYSNDALLPLSMKVKAVDAGAWDNMKASELEEIVESLSNNPPAEMRLGQGRSAIYVFKTLQGAMGMVELFDKASGAVPFGRPDDSRGVGMKIRYKLVSKIEEAEDKLKGEWEIVSASADATYRHRVAKVGDRIRIEHVNELVSISTPQPDRDYYMLARGDTPGGSKFDVTFWVENLFQVQRGIYQQDGDTLTMCVARINEERPSKFIAEKDKSMLLTLKRVVPTTDGASAPAPTAKFVATQEQAMRVEILLKNAPVTTNFIAPLFEPTPGTPGEFRMSAEVVSTPIILDGKSPADALPEATVLYLPSKKKFFMQRDNPEANTLHYYGPFDGDPATKLGLKLIGKSSQPSEPKADPVFQKLNEQLAAARAQVTELLKIHKPVDPEVASEQQVITALQDRIAELSKSGEAVDMNAEMLKFQPAPGVALPPLDAKSGTGLVFKAAPQRPVYNIGDRIWISLDISNPTGQLKPIGWTTTGVGHFTFVEGDKIKSGGISPQVTPQIKEPLLVGPGDPPFSEKIIYLPPAHTVNLLLDCGPAQAPGKFRGRISYDPVTHSGSTDVPQGDIVASGVFEYKVAAPRGQPAATPAPALQHSGKFPVTQDQVKQIEAFIKDAPVTENYLADLFELTPGSDATYRMRADVVRLPVVPAEKSPMDFVPFGEVLSLPASARFYIQWDGIAASSYHYYGPFVGDPAQKLGLKLVAAPPAPKTEPLSHDENEKIVTATRSFIESLEKGTFDKALAQYHEKAGPGQPPNLLDTSVFVPAAKLAAFWSDLGKTGGKYIGHQDPVADSSGGYATSVILCTWENKKIIFEIYFKADLLVEVWAVELK